MKTSTEKKSADPLGFCCSFMNCKSHKDLALAAFEYEEMLYENGWSWSKKKMTQVKDAIVKLYALMRQCDQADLEGRYKSLYPQPLKNYFPIARQVPVKLTDTPWVEELIFNKKLHNQLEQYCGA